MGEKSSFLDNTIGLINALINRHRTQKAIEQIHKENATNQGITHYLPSPIEAFFDHSELMANMILSGGANYYRSRGITRAIECAYINGYSVVILHTSNTHLEEMVARDFGSGNVVQINKNNPIYDPFIGLSNSDISRMVLGSASKLYKIQSQGKYYIDGMSDFIRSKKISPYCLMYIKCPHLYLIDRINEAEAQGKISNQLAQKIISQVMLGEAERGNIDNFFMAFASQSKSILSTKANIKSAANIKLAAKQKKVIMVDVLTSTHDLLINMLCNEVVNLLATGEKVFFVIDDIPLNSSEMLQEIQQKSGGNCSLLLAAGDAYSSFGGNEEQFTAFLGKSSKIVIFKHTSAYSCQKWSDVIGSYDKQDISSTFSHNVNYMGNFALGSSQTIGINNKRESKVKPEEIAGMQEREVYVISRSSGEIAHILID